MTDSKELLSEVFKLILSTIGLLGSLILLACSIKWLFS